MLLILEKSVTAGVEKSQRLARDGRTERPSHGAPAAACPTAEKGKGCRHTDTENLPSVLGCRAGLCVRNEGNTNISAHTLKNSNGGEKPKAQRTLLAGDRTGGGRQGLKPHVLERTWVVLTEKRRECVDIPGEATGCGAAGRTRAAWGVFLPKTRADLTRYRAPTPSPQEVWGRQEDIGPTRNQIWNVEYFKAGTAWFLPEKKSKETKRRVPENKT